MRVYYVVVNFHQSPQLPHFVASQQYLQHWLLSRFVRQTAMRIPEVQQRLLTSRSVIQHIILD